MGDSYLHSNFQRATGSQVVCRHVDDSLVHSIHPDEYSPDAGDKWLLIMEDNKHTGKFNILVLSDSVAPTPVRSSNL